MVLDGNTDGFKNEDVFVWVVMVSVRQCLVILEAAVEGLMAAPSSSLEVGELLVVCIIR